MRTIKNDPLYWLRTFQVFRREKGFFKLKVSISHYSAGISLTFNWTNQIIFFVQNLSRVTGTVHKINMPFSVLIPLNMSICVRTFAHASTASKSARELHLFLLLCTCFSTCVDKPGILPQLLNMRTSSSHDPGLVYISLNMCICVRTFAHVTCESAREYCTFCCSCAHAPPPVLINLNFPRTPKHAHK